MPRVQITISNYNSNCVTCLSLICLKLSKIKWGEITLCSFFFFFWVNKTLLFTLVYIQVHLPFYNNQNPKSFVSFNIQLPSSSINAMEFQKNISVSMMHVFLYLIQDRGSPSIPIVLSFTTLKVLLCKTKGLITPIPSFL